MSCAQVDFAFSAAEMVGTELQLTASSAAGSGAFTADLAVLAPQDQVFVAADGGRLGLQHLRPHLMTTR